MYTLFDILVLLSSINWNVFCLAIEYQLATILEIRFIKLDREKESERDRLRGLEREREVGDRREERKCEKSAR